MSTSEDVKALFRRFGGNASSYREIVSDDQVGQAEQKWPMLRQIDPSSHEEAPSVRRVNLADSGVRQLQEVSPPPMPIPEARAVPELRDEAPAERLFPRADASPEKPPVVHQSLIHAASPPPSPAPAKAGWFGRRAAPPPVPTPKPPVAVPVVRAPTPPAPVPAPARITAAQTVKPVARRKSAVAGRGRTDGSTRPDSPLPSSSGTGLAKVFSSKLAPAHEVHQVASRIDAPADAGGLGGMFQRIAATPALDAKPTVSTTTSRKRAVRW